MSSKYVLNSLPTSLLQPVSSNSREICRASRRTSSVHACIVRDSEQMQFSSTLLIDLMGLRGLAVMGCGLSALLKQSKVVGMEPCKMARRTFDEQLDLERFVGLPDEILGKIFQFLSAAETVRFEAALGDAVNTNVAWRNFCLQKGLISRDSYRCVGNVVITNRPGKSLSWKSLYFLDRKTEKPQKYLSYSDTNNQKYVVFVN